MVNNVAQLLLCTNVLKNNFECLQLVQHICSENELSKVQFQDLMFMEADLHLPATEFISICNTVFFLLFKNQTLLTRDASQGQTAGLEAPSRGKSWNCFQTKAPS